MCAPTGRAAQRLREITKNPACTIHKLIGAQRGWNCFVCVCVCVCVCVFVRLCVRFCVCLFYFFQKKKKKKKNSFQNPPLLLLIFSGRGPTKDKNNLLDLDALIIDETSMVDIPLMHDLLR